MNKIAFIAAFLFFLFPQAFAGEDPSAYLKKGSEQLKDGKYQGAIKTFERAIRIDPACAMAYAGIGEAYLGLGDNPISSDPELIEKGISNLHTAVSLNPRLAIAHYRLAVAYLTLKNKDAALREYEILKGIDKEEAARLYSQIGKYRAPKNYRLVGSTSSAQGRGSSAEIRNSSSGARPGVAGGKSERFTGTVELYVTSWCPVCERAISYMKKKGISFVAYDIEADEQARKRFDELGGRGVPLIVIGKNKISGFSPGAVDQYVGK